MPKFKKNPNPLKYGKKTPFKMAGFSGTSEKAQNRSDILSGKKKSNISNITNEWKEKVTGVKNKEGSGYKGSSPARFYNFPKIGVKRASYYKGNSEFKQSNYNKKISELK